MLNLELGREMIRAGSASGGPNRAWRNAIRTRTVDLPPPKAESPSITARVIGIVRSIAGVWVFRFTGRAVSNGVSNPLAAAAMMFSSAHKKLKGVTLCCEAV